MNSKVDQLNKKLDLYELGKMVCSAGGREIVTLLAQRRARQLAELLKQPADTPLANLGAYVHSIKLLDEMKGTIDRGLEVYIKASNASTPDWKKEELLREKGDDGA
jgi:hypothetical protein